MVKEKSLIEKVYKNIKENILEGIVQPRERLYEVALAKEYHTSRGPVREALIRLKEEKLIVSIDKKGLYVAPIRKKEIKEIFEIRKTLEMLAIEKSIGNLQLEEFEQMKDEFEAFKYFELSHENKILYLILDRKFHHSLFKNCDNKRLVELLLHYQEQMKRFQKYALNISTFEITIKEHLNIIKSIKKGDIELIKRNLLNHFERVEQSYFYQFME